jgi:hypothetical protein
MAINNFDHYTPINRFNAQNDNNSDHILDEQMQKLLQPSPSAAATEHVNQNVTQAGDNRVGGKEASMSDEFNNTSYKLGKIEAELETHKAGQARLETSIAKISENIEKLSGEIISKVEKKIDDKFNLIDSKIDAKLAGFETKMEKSTKENNRWVFGIAFTIISILFANVYFTISHGKTNNSKLDVLTRYDNQPQALEQQQPNIAPKINPTKPEKKTP